MQADGSDNSRNDSLKDFFRSVRLGKVNGTSSFMTYHWVCNWTNTTGSTSRAGTDYASGGTQVRPQFLVGFVLPDL
jgi:hypothetical protein